MKVEIDAAIFIAGIDEFSDPMDILIQSLSSQSPKVLRSIIIERPEAIRSIRNPSKKLIQLAIDLDPTLVRHYMADFHTFPKEFKDYIYERLARINISLLGDLISYNKEPLRLRTALKELQQRMASGKQE